MTVPSIYLLKGSTNDCVQYVPLQSEHLLLWPVPMSSKLALMTVSSTYLLKVSTNNCFQYLPPQT